MSANNEPKKIRLAPLLAFAAIDVLFLTVAFLAGYVVRASTAERPLVLPFFGGSVGGSYPLLGEVRGLLEAHFIGTMPDEKTLEYGLVRGLVAAVGDPYTVFVEPQAAELESQSFQGEYGGIGVNVTANDAGEVVLSPLRDSPAERAGIVEGDVLLAVDDTRLEPGMGLDAVTALVRGLIGTPARLTVRHPDGSEATLDVLRERIEIPSVMWKMLEGQAGMGLITISRFSDKTSEEVGRALNELRQQGASRFVLDLRNNGGGILEAAVNVSGYFLDGGVVMYETQRSGPEKTYSAPPVPGAALNEPLAILVNHNTASAAEIVAGALLDRGRGPLIGQATYGKGSVQLVYDLSDGSSLHVTAFRWYTPSRRELEKAGLPPTYAVEPATDGSDAELAYAIEYLNTVGRAAPTPLAQISVP